MIFFIASLFSALLLVLPWPALAFKVIVLGVYLLIQSYILGRIFFYRLRSWFRWLLGFLLLLTSIIILGTTTFYLYNLSYWPLVLISFLPTLLMLTRSKQHQKVLSETVAQESTDAKLRPAYLIPIIMYLAVIAGIFLILVNSATTEPIQSPWLATPPYIFLLYGAATAILLTFFLWSKRFQPVLVSLHFFISLSLILFIYPLGFGFDPFIHQATEKIILSSGSLSPKPFYYVGQYSLIVWLAYWSGLSVKYLDSWLLPLLASLFLPSVIYYSFRENFRSNVQAVNVLPFIFLAWPYATLIQTTPQGLSFLFSLIVIFISLFYINQQGIPLLFIVAVSVAATLIHPLTGIPLLFFSVLLGLYHRFWHQDGIKKYLRLAGYWVMTLLAAIILPIIFFVNSLLSKQNPVNINLDDSSSTSLNILQWYYHPYFRLEDIIYLIDTNSRLLLLLAAGIGLGYIIYQRKAHYFFHYLITFIVLLCNYVFISLFVHFDFLISYERFIFPERILYLSFYFLWPFALLAGYLLFKRALRRPPVVLVIIIGLTSALLTISWYLSYPRFDFQEQNKGFNSSIYDSQTVDWINHDAQGVDYIVLANQSVSAMAVDHYGFARYYRSHFYYPIPTGDALYQSYLDLVRNRKSSDAVMGDVMALTGVKRVYLVVNDYWSGFEDIIKLQKKSAQSFQIIGTDKNYIFSYQLP